MRARGGRRCGIAALVLLILGLQAVAPARAAGQPEAGALASSAEQDRAARTRSLQSKLKLLDRLVHEAPAVARIEAGKDPQAKELLASARSAYQQARNELDAGRLDDAEEQIEEAFDAIGTAARAVKDTRREDELARQKYRELEERVSSFREVLDGIERERKGQGPLVDEKRLDRLTRAALKLADSGHYEQANARLAQAADLVEEAVARARHKQTLVHALSFESPEQEYEYEVQRNQSHKMLVALVVQEKQPDQRTQDMMQQMVARSEELRGKAQAQAERGETQDAIATLEEATQQLIRALRLGGLAMP